jgi:hypothetical protein
MPQVQGEYLPPEASRYTSQAAEQIRVLKASPGILYTLLVTNIKLTDVWLYVFDNTSAAGTLFMPPMKLPASGGNLSLPLGQALPFFTGLTVASSSTGSTYTPTATNDLFIGAQFK